MVSVLVCLLFFFLIKNPPKSVNEPVTWYLLKLLRVDLEEMHLSVNHRVLLWFLFLEYAYQRKTSLLFELSASLLKQFSVIPVFVLEGLLLMKAVLTTHTLEISQIK